MSARVANPTERGRTGLWREPGVPHRGWTCVDTYDLDAPDATCEMCCTAEIRFVHVMSHRSWPNDLRVGVVCAEAMEGDYATPHARERHLRNLAKQRARWLTRRWRRSQKGNTFLNAGGFNVVVYPVEAGWSYRVRERDGHGVGTTKATFPSETTARLAAFVTWRQMWEAAHGR